MFSFLQRLCTGEKNIGVSLKEEKSQKALEHEAILVVEIVL